MLNARLRRGARVGVLHGLPKTGQRSTTVTETNRPTTLVPDLRGGYDPKRELIADGDESDMETYSIETPGAQVVYDITDAQEERTRIHRSS